MNNKALALGQLTEASSEIPKNAPPPHSGTTPESLPITASAARTPQFLKWLLYPLAAVAIFLVIKVAMLMGDVSAILNTLLGV